MLGERSANSEVDPDRGTEANPQIGPEAKVEICSVRASRGGQDEQEEEAAGGCRIEGGRSRGVRCATRRRSPNWRRGTSSTRTSFVPGRRSCSTARPGFSSVRWARRRRAERLSLSPTARSGQLTVEGDFFSVQVRSMIRTERLAMVERGPCDLPVRYSGWMLWLRDVFRPRCASRSSSQTGARADAGHGVEALGFEEETPRRSTASTVACCAGSQSTSPTQRQITRHHHPAVWRMGASGQGGDGTAVAN